MGHTDPLHRPIPFPQHDSVPWGCMSFIGHGFLRLQVIFKIIFKYDWIFTVIETEKKKLRLSL